MISTIKIKLKSNVNNGEKIRTLEHIQKKLIRTNFEIMDGYNMWLYSFI